MKYNTANQLDRAVGLLKKAGRTGIALLLVTAMLLTALPLNSGNLLAYAGSDAAVSASDSAQSGAPAAVENINLVLPLTPAVTASGSDVSAADVSGSDTEKHICVIHGFEGYTPGTALDMLTAESAAALRAMLPRTLTGVMGCEDCSDTIDVEWELSGGVYRAVLDPERYSYVVADDPETRDIDESCTSPWCDLPYIEFTIPAGDVTSGSDVSGSDVSGRPVVPSENISITVPVSGTDVISGSDVISGADVTSGSDVSASDVSGSDVSASDVSGSDVSGSDAASGSPAPGVTVSGADISSGSQVLPLCTCHTHCYADHDNGQYVVDIKCPACSADPTACLVAPDMPERVLEFTAGDGRLVTVAGPLPEGAALSVEPVAFDDALQMLGEESGLELSNICFAYDIKIIYEGQAFQPGDYGSTVTVSINSVGALQAESLEVYHISEGEAELVEVRIENDSTAAFDTDGFSIYVGATAYEYPSVTEIYVWRPSGSGDADHYFFINSNASGTSEALRKTSNGEFYHRIQDIINDYCPVGGALTIYTVATYCTNGTETIDGTGKNITIKQYAGHARNVINVINGSLTLKNVTVDAAYTVEKTYDLDSTVLVNAGKALILEEGAILKDGSSHGVYLNGSGAKLTMNGGQITGHKASDKASHSGLTGSADSGTVDANGAGVYVDEGATFEMKGGVISGNTAAKKGAGVYLAGTMTMTGGTISGNTANVDGAGIFAASGSTLTISNNSVITGNTATNSGGGIWAEGTAVMNGGSIDNNTASTHHGGGVIVYQGGKFTMNGGSINDNKALASYGGGVAVYAESKASTFIMNGGSITGNTANKTGGGINSNYGSNTIAISGGTISGNTAGAEGGGIYNNGNMTMSGGALTGNTAGTLGGGIYVTGNGETHITGTAEISGNTSPDSSTKDGGDGICTANSGSTNPHLLMSGSPLITDVISLGFAGNIANNDISIYGTFTPRSVINIALRASSVTEGEEVVTTLKSYTNVNTYATRNATDDDIANFAMVDPRLYLYYDTTDPFQLKIGKTTNIAYYSADGTGDGSTPDKPTSSMAAAYTRLKDKGGTIFMLTDFKPTSDVTLTGKSITYEGSTVSVTGTGSVIIKRYSKQSGYSAASNTAYSLITVSDGVTVNLSDITIDGHNRRLENSLAGTGVTAEPLTSVSQPSVVVNGGTLNVTGYTRFKDSPASSMGGAIYVDGTGAVSISGNTIFDNSTSAVGENVYVNSDSATVTLSGTVAMGSGDIHLETAGAKITTTSAVTYKDENAANLLDVTLSDDASKTGGPGRVIAHYTDGNPDADKYSVTNSSGSAYEIETRGDNVILKAVDEYTLTAAAEVVVLAEGAYNSFDIDLNDQFGSSVLSGAADVSLTVTATSSLYSCSDIDTNARVWGTAVAAERFGLDANGTDLSSGSVSISVPTDGIVNIKLHNANAITETKEKVNTITLTVTIGGHQRMFTVYINTQGGTICVTVPLKITGTVDAMGEFTLPTADAYAISNQSTFPVKVTAIKWEWEDGASKLFSNVDAMSAEVKLGESANQHIFSNTFGLNKNITDGTIAALSKLGLAWDMLMGNNNYIRSTTTEHVATITYTIDIVE